MFQERTHDLARTVPNGNGGVLLLPGLGHLPHIEAPDKVRRRWWRFSRKD